MLTLTIYAQDEEEERREAEYMHTRYPGTEHGVPDPGALAQASSQQLQEVKECLNVILANQSQLAHTVRGYFVSLPCVCVCVCVCGAKTACDLLAGGGLVSRFCRGTRAVVYHIGAECFVSCALTALQTCNTVTVMVVAIATVTVGTFWQCSPH